MAINPPLGGTWAACALLRAELARVVGRAGCCPACGEAPTGAVFPKATSASRSSLLLSSVLAMVSLVAEVGCVQKSEVMFSCCCCCQVTWRKNVEEKRGGKTWKKYSLDLARRHHHLAPRQYQNRPQRDQKYSWCHQGSSLYLLL